MSDLKYGRLFTEEDVTSLLDWITGGTLESPAPAVIEQYEKEHPQAPLRFPADEPLFLVRAKDTISLAAVDSYCDNAEARDFPVPTPTLEQFITWRSQNPELVRDPN